MERETNRHKVFTRRALLLGGGQLSLVAVLIGRMYYLQVIESDQYHMLAEENRINMRLLPPPRGLIVDRFGREAANNRQNYQVVMVAEQVDDVEATIDQLSHVVPINERQRRKAMREIRRSRPFVPVTIAENLTWEQFSRLNVVLPELSGVQPDAGLTRHYPYADTLAHVVGYVSAVAESELNGDPLLELPGFRTGKSGIEKTYDKDLRGKAGTQRVEVNAFGRVIRELAREDGEPGEDVVLTIDAELQQSIARRLGEESAAAVVLDIHTGEVLAMVSTPAYDPNAFNMGLSAKTWQELVSHPRAPLINKAVAGQYPPGSTFKPVVAMAGLESGAITPDKRIFCNGVVKLGNAKFHCWKARYGGHGWLDMKGAIEQSCDVYFYELARRLGLDRISAMATRFGLGEKLDVGLPAERGGLVPTRDWKLAVFGTPWQLGETLITGIGQAYLLATPLQLAVMTARIANGGRAVRPTLTRAVGSEQLAAERGAVPSMGLSRGNLQIVQAAMSEVVNSVHGTAHRYRLDDALGAKMAGKTGTAQVRRITKAERQAGGHLAEGTPWEERDHGLFVAFAPVDEPRYATAVVVEHAGSSSFAAEITRDVMTDVLQRDPLRRSPLGQLASRRARGERS